MGHWHQFSPLLIATLGLTLAIASLFVPLWRLRISGDDNGLTTRFWEFRYDEVCETTNVEVDATVEGISDFRSSKCVNYGGFINFLRLVTDSDRALPNEVAELSNKLNAEAHVVVLAVGICLTSLGLMVGCYNREYPYEGAAKFFMVTQILGGALTAASLIVFYFESAQPILRAFEQIRDESPTVAPTSSPTPSPLDQALRNAESGAGLILLILGSILTWLAAFVLCCANCCEKKKNADHDTRSMNMKTIEITS